MKMSGQGVRLLIHSSIADSPRVGLTEIEALKESLVVGI